MLVIREEQMDKITKGGELEWVEFLVSHVKENDPEIQDEYDDRALRSMVSVGIEKAKGYGFTKAGDQSAFVSLMFEISPNFDSQPEIAAVLDDGRLSPSARLEKLWSPAVSNEVWEKAADSYDEATWQNDEIEAGS